MCVPISAMRGAGITKQSEVAAELCVRNPNRASCHGNGFRRADEGTVMAMARTGLNVFFGADLDQHCTAGLGRHQLTTDRA